MGSQKKDQPKKVVRKRKTTAVRKKKPVQVFKTVTFDDEEFQIAIIQKGSDITDEQKIDIMKVAFLMYSSDMYSLEECLKHVGIKSDSTFYKWLDSIKEIEELYIKAKSEKDRRYTHRIKHRARTKLEKAIDGYTVDLVETKSEAVAVQGKDGNVEGYQMQIVEVKKKQIYVRPSEKIILAVLYNTDGKIIQRNPDAPEEDQDPEILSVDYSKLSTEELIERAKAVKAIKEKE